MGIKKTKWLIYTVLIGLLPFLIRLLIYIIRKGAPVEYVFNEIDLITFGLVLHLSNINELENITNVDQNWKTKNIGLSVIMIIFFSSFLALAYLSDLDNTLSLDRNNIKYCAASLSVASFIMSYSIYDRLGRQE